MSTVDSQGDITLKQCCNIKHLLKTEVKEKLQIKVFRFFVGTISILNLHRWQTICLWFSLKNYKCRTISQINVDHEVVREEYIKKKRETKKLEDCEGTWRWWRKRGIRSQRQRQKGEEESMRILYLGLELRFT